MSHGNQSYLRFSLEESVWFQRGQEVEELISISLDPNISINESDQYITIKGSLELYGEYNRDEYDFDEENEIFTNPKFVQTVEVREEGVCFFTHHFPVEVTIPKNRIQDIENIDVAVETFDYAFPERSCLRLSADLMITGLYGEQKHEFFQENEDDFIEELDDELLIRTEELENSLENELDEDEALIQEYTEIPIDNSLSEIHSPFSMPEREEEWEEEIYEPFEVEVRKEAKADETLKGLTEELEREEIQGEPLYQRYEEEEESVAETYDFTLLEREGVINEEDEQPVLEREDVINEEDEQPVLEREGVINEEDEQPVLEREDVINEEDEQPPVLEREDVIDEEDEQLVLEKEESKTTAVPEFFIIAKRNEQEAVQNNDEKEAAQYIPPKTETQPVEEQEESSEEELAPANGKKKKWKKKQSLSITEFLARKEETSESHTTVKVCIVQKGDSLDTLSDRYDVSVTHLQRLNNLDINQDVFEGQVLYIPVVQTQK